MNMLHECKTPNPFEFTPTPDEILENTEDSLGSYLTHTITLNIAAWVANTLLPVAVVIYTARFAKRAGRSFVRGFKGETV